MCVCEIPSSWERTLRSSPETSEADMGQPQPEAMTSQGPGKGPQQGASLLSSLLGTCPSKNVSIGLLHACQGGWTF